jgi:arylsulfatase
MSILVFFRFWSKILDHRLSPAPLVVACVGFWMPLEWMHYGQDVIGQAPWIERVHAIAASVWLNFLPTALLMAIAIYAVAGVFALLPWFSFRKIAENGIYLCVYLITLGVTARALGIAFTENWFMPIWFKVACLLACILGSVLLTRSRIDTKRWMLVPSYIAVFAIPLAFVLILEEAEQTATKGIWQQQFKQMHAASAGSIHSGLHTDVILITVDTFSAKHLRLYGYARPTSPYLENFAKESIVFERFYADANWTSPGVASLLNGARPWTHQGDTGTPLRKVTEAQNLVTDLENVGYDVRTINSNLLADLEWQGVTALPDHREILYPHYSLSFLFEKYLPSAFSSAQIGPDHLLKMRVLSIRAIFLGGSKPTNYLERTGFQLQRASTTCPTFVWLHILTPHDPYGFSQPYLGRFDSSTEARTPATSAFEYGFVNHLSLARQQVLEARYDEAVLMTDDTIGQFLQQLKQQGRYDRSLIVITADHGESFNPRYRGHGGPLLLEDIIRVPLLIKPPFYHGSQRESRLFEQADVAPTILSYLHLPIPVGMEGQAYPEKTSNVPVFSMNRDLQAGEHSLNVAMREGDWKYVLHLGHWKHPWPQRELYNLAQDPQEQTNLVDREPARGEVMRQRILQEVVRHGIALDEFRP